MNFSKFKFRNSCLTAEQYLFGSLELDGYDIGVSKVHVHSYSSFSVLILDTIL